MHRSAVQFGFVGNDVVDFAVPAVLAAYLRPRFVERTCTHEEQAGLAMSARPGPHICALFAAKEAAYKVISKIRQGIVFEHRRFVVSPRFDTVSYDDWRIHLRVSDGDAFAHAVAWIGRAMPVHAIGWAKSGGDSSLGARQLLYEDLALRTGRQRTDFTVIRDARTGSWDGFGPPKLMVRGISDAIDVSLSHDGRLLAFAVHLPPVERRRSEAASTDASARPVIACTPDRATIEGLP